MAAFVRLPSGSWRAVVRRKRRYISETFKRKEDARSWAIEAERQIDQGVAPTSTRVKGMKTFGQLIDLHIADMKEVGKAPGRSKSATLAMLKRELGNRPVIDIDRERLIKFGRDRAAQVAGPVTVSMDIGAIRLVISHAAAVHGLSVSMEQVDLARIALKRLGLVGKSNERDRRPTEEELQRLFKHFDGITRPSIPMSRVMQFAMATAMRQEEIFRVSWDDYNPRTKMLAIRDRKDPRETTSASRCSTSPATTPSLLSKSSARSAATKTTASSRITTSPPERRSPGPAAFSGSSTCTSMTCGTKAPAASSRPGWRSSRPRS